LPAQVRVATSSVSKEINVSLMTHADDLLNLNRSADRLSKNFRNTINRGYVGFSLNMSNLPSSFLMLSTAKEKSHFGDSVVKPSESITYLGLPIV